MDDVDVAPDGAVWTVTINRPDKRNAVDPDTALQLRAAFDAFEADETAAVAVLTGTGGVEPLRREARSGAARFTGGAGRSGKAVTD